MTGDSNLAHLSGDKLLTTLTELPGITGRYVAVFPGKENDQSAEWVNDWFLDRCNWFYENIDSTDVPDQISDDCLKELLSIENSTNVKQPVKILSIHPYYFRGFRGLENPISLSSDLVVLDGPNSSGKTSITEAFEFLIKGELLRRSLTIGNERELENCISNQLKPENELTWVEAVFITESGERIVLKRILLNDYGCRKNSTPTSKFLKDGIELEKDEEIKVIDDLFAGEYPVLMQHSLRLFVSSTPTERRDYFERLLHLDDLTFLIEKSVVGDSTKKGFQYSTGGDAINKWQNFIDSVQDLTSKQMLKGVSDKHEGLNRIVRETLLGIAKIEFSDYVDESMSFEHVQENLGKLQQAKRQQEFSLLKILEPKKEIDEQLLQLFSIEEFNKKVNFLKEAFSVLQEAKKAASEIEDAQIAIAEAYQILKSKGLISDSDGNQVCPLCNYEKVETFTSTRKEEIQAWQPIQKALEEATSKLASEIVEFEKLSEEIYSSRISLLPLQPDETVWTQELNKLDEEVVVEAGSLRLIFTDQDQSLSKFDNAYLALSTLLGATEFDSAKIEAIAENAMIFSSHFAKVIELAKKYKSQFDTLEETVGIIVGSDPDYDLREQWLDLVKVVDQITSEIHWEQAKDKAQNELKLIRDYLKTARDVFLENKRMGFSGGIDLIWNKLRKDRYSVYNDLRIPPPRGKGYPVEIEILATLDDGNQQVEVDALRVFSESQINVLGISAFITRSRLIGHKTLIIDDPVQSMDEEHFLTFAKNLIPYLLDEGFQVIILTHNDRFARDISHIFFNSEVYVTLSVRHSRRVGCVVEEGNRRVAERLKKAEKLADSGEFDRAWLAIRRAIERLYLVTYIQYGPSTFSPYSWQNQTADYMWGSDEEPRVGVIIEEKSPGSGDRLKEIVDMSVAGAHDKQARGYTDIIEAINFLRPLLPILKVGG